MNDKLIFSLNIISVLLNFFCVYLKIMSKCKFGLNWF